MFDGNYMDINNRIVCLITGYIITTYNDLTVGPSPGNIGEEGKSSLFMALIQVSELLQFTHMVG